MSCPNWRELISADLDGEPIEREAVQLAAHVGQCPDCQTYRAAVTRLHRTVRVTPAPQVPDLTPAILAQAPPVRRANANPGIILRTALVGVALVQLASSLPELISHPGAAHVLHEPHHLAAWDVAFAFALLVLARQPWRARGFLPIAAALGAVMVFSAGADLLNGNTPGMPTATHFLEVSGLILTWALARQHRGDPGPASSGDRSRTGTRAGPPWSRSRRSRPTAPSARIGLLPHHWPRTLRASEDRQAA